MSMQKDGFYSSSTQTFISLHPFLLSPSYDFAKRKVIKKPLLKRCSTIFISDGNYYVLRDGKPVKFEKEQSPTFNF